MTLNHQVQKLHSRNLRIKMPTLQRFGAVTLRMYADDHDPPHFHIVGVDFQVLVRIADLSILAGKAKPALLANALEWAETHREELTLKWAELNERG